MNYWSMWQDGWTFKTLPRLVRRGRRHKTTSSKSLRVDREWDRKLGDRHREYGCQEVWGSLWRDRVVLKLTILQRHELETRSCRWIHFSSLKTDSRYISTPLYSLQPKFWTRTSCSEPGAASSGGRAESEESEACSMQTAINSNK